MKLVAYCEECGHKHPICFDPSGANLLRTNQELSDWYTKHQGHKGVGYCNAEFSPKPSFVDRFKAAWDWVVRPFGLGKQSIAPNLKNGSPFDLPPPPALSLMGWNANIKIAYAASTAFTITLASLASSSSLLTGRQGTAISNASSLYLDHLVAATIMTGTSPAATSIELWIVAPLNDTPTWPDQFGASDSGRSVTTRAILGLCARLHNIAVTSTTSNEGNPFAPTSVAGLFGGTMPLQIVPFVVQNTGVNLNSTGGNHGVYDTGCYATSI